MYPVTITAVDPSRDYDGDGCTDAQELWAGKPGGAANCGDDPWNPLDSISIGSSADNIAGVYGVQVRLARQDITGGGTFIPGHYITCSAYVQKGLATPTPGLNVEARLLCNHDSPTEKVNPNYGSTCGANPNLCGDGLPGAPPPGCNNLPATCQAASPDTAHGGTCNFARGYPPYNEPPCFDLADLTTVKWLFPPVGKPADTYPVPAARQTALTGTISANTLTLAGCFRDYNNTAVDGNSYWSLKANVHTGVGTVNIWRNLSAGEQTAGNCTPLTANPPGAAPGRTADYGTMPIQLTRQTADTCTANLLVCNPLGGTTCAAGSTAPCGYNTAKWDSDGDTCPDAWELSDVTNVPYRKAGLRDPQNRWDYMDVNHDGVLDIGDQADVVQKYFIDKGFVVASGGVASITRTVASGSVSSITRSGSTATATTAAAHGLPLGTGSWVRITSASPTAYNGTKAVTVTGASTFTYLVSGSLTTPATGTITWDARTGTVTTAAPQTLTSGTVVTIAGATQGQYNGLFPITVADSTHFTYAVTGTGAVPASPATGTITWATGGGGGPDNLPAGYLIDTDRTGLAGSEDWELNSPDGYVTIDDVVDSANSYGHDCPPAGAGNLPAPNAG